MEIDIALGIVVHPSERRVLVARRPTGVHLSGYWEFPGGKVHACESVTDAVEREVMEETGVGVRVLRGLLPVVHTYPERTVRLMPYLCRALSSSAKAKASTEIRWIPFEEITDLPFPEGNRSIVEELAKLFETVDDLDAL